VTARGWEILAAFAVGCVAYWAWMARYRPTAPCRWCRGRKKVGNRKRWRKRKRCRRCGGTGERTVWGAGFMGGKRWGE
jgi:hypothetical protein